MVNRISNKITSTIEKTEKKFLKKTKIKSHMKKHILKSNNYQKTNWQGRNSRMRTMDNATSKSMKGNNYLYCKRKKKSNQLRR